MQNKKRELRVYFLEVTVNNVTCRIYINITSAHTINITVYIILHNYVILPLIIIYFCALKIPRFPFHFQSIECCRIGRKHDIFYNDDEVRRFKLKIVQLRYFIEA